jgi:predicted MPP superfamily phosphohydrolase
MALADEIRPLEERLTRRLIRRPYGDAEGRKGWLTAFARAQMHIVARYTLALPGWPRFERPLRIAFLSDFHVGSHTGDIARLSAIADEVIALSPDLVLFGGDYMNLQIAGGGRVPPVTVAQLLSRMTGRHGRFAILGNHDYVYSAGDVAEALRGHGIAVLDHEHGVFSFGGHEIGVLGLPDAHVTRPEARALLRALDPGRPAIVLAHDPVWFADVPSGPFLTLSGHTHGGQVKLPFVGVLRNASAAPLRWSHGLIAEGGRHLIVTAGLGTSMIPLRIGVPPEFAVIEVNGA